MGSLIPLYMRVDYDCHVAALRSSLGETAFAKAWAEGRAMTLDQAIAYALESTASTENVSSDVNKV